MRAASFLPHALREFLLGSKIATLDELKQALGTPVDITVFRKLKLLDYLTSYSHRGRLLLATSFGPLRRFNLAHLGTLWVR